MQIDVPNMSKSVQTRTKRRAKEGKCLLCDGLPKRRGLCVGHYMKFARARQKLDGIERLEFDLRCVAAGQILGVQEVRKFKAG